MRATSRLVIGPLLVALLAGIELWRFSVVTAVVGGYFALVVAEATVFLWGRVRLRLARRRLATRHRLRGRRP